MKNVLVLGGTGMLGSMVVDVLSREAGLAVTATARDGALKQRLAAALPNVRWTDFAFQPGGLKGGSRLFEGQQWVVNCIGITKPLIRDDNPAEIERAIAVNAILPQEAAYEAAQHGATVLQIATDCVYSGAKGSYSETDAHDALDVYGKTKSLGETYLPATRHLRCSIIGPEPRDFKFLIEWFRRQPQGAQVNGFTNHLWNGVTTLHFARLCAGVIRTDVTLPHLQHVVPTGADTKAQMLRDFAAAYSRPDIDIRKVEAKTVIDRTLSTANPALNRQLWEAAGYGEPPTVGQMIAELGSFDYKAGA